MKAASGVPEAAAEDPQVEPSAFGGGEGQVLLARVRVEMCGEFAGEEWGEADGAPCGGCLDRFLDSELAAGEVDAVYSECCEFAGAEAGVRAGEDEHPAAGWDGLGEVFDFVDGKEALLGLLDAGDGDARQRPTGRTPATQITGYGRVGWRCSLVLLLAPALSGVVFCPPGHEVVEVFSLKFRT